MKLKIRLDKGFTLRDIMDGIDEEGEYLLVPRVKHFELVEND